MEAPREGTTVVPASQLTLEHRLVAGQYQIRPHSIERGPEGTVVVMGHRTRLGSTPGGSVDEPTTKTYGRGQGAVVVAVEPEALDPFDRWAAADLEERLQVEADKAAEVIADTYG